jgi:rRNA maturation endonuclease Nob1
MNWYQCTKCKCGMGTMETASTCPICGGTLEPKTVYETPQIETLYLIATTEPLKKVIVSLN